MSKEEIALELALAMIDKGSFATPSGEGAYDNDSYGKTIAELFNAIYKSLEV